MDPSDPDASSLASQLTEAVAADDPVDESPPDSQEATPPPADADPPPPSEGRDDKGRFTPKAKEPEKLDTALQTPPVPDPKSEPQAGALPTPNVDIPPDTLTAAGKTAYLKCTDPVLKKEIWKREQDYRAGSQQHKQALQQFEQGHQIAQGLAQACSPYVPHIQAAGSNLMQAIPYALQQVYEMNTNPVAVIARIAQGAGIDLAQLAQHAAQQPQADPQVQQLQQQIWQMQQHLQGGQQQVQQQQEQEALGLIQNFRTDPKNIYFSNVEEQVIGLLRSGLVQGSTPAERLSKAYAQACLLNPEVSAAINAQQQRDAESKRLNEAKQRAASAKRAGFNVAGSGGLSGKATKDMSIEDSLRTNLGL